MNSIRELYFTSGSQHTLVVETDFVDSATEQRKVTNVFLTYSTNKKNLIASTL